MYDRIVRIKQTRLYTIETIFAVCILLAINYIFFPTRPSFDGISPSPYWIIILAVSARYGRTGALFSSSIVSVVFIANYVLTFSGFEVFYDDPWLLRYPFLFFIIGFLIGEVKTAFLLREDYLTKRVEELEQLSERLKGEHEVLSEAHKNLTSDVATTPETMTVLSKISERLKSLDTNDIYIGTLECLEKYLDVEESSFYELNEHKLDLKFSRGWKDYYRRPETYELGSGLIGQAAEEKQILTIKDFITGRSEEKQPDIIGDSVLVLPIIGIEGRLYGIISIEKIPFLKLTESAIQKAKVICEFAASSLNTASVYRSMEKKQIKETKTNIYKYHYFKTRLEEEYLRADNYMLPLSVMAFNWPELSKLDEEKKDSIFQSLLEIINTDLRPFDVLALGPTNKTPLVLLLTTTSGRQADSIKENIIKKIDDYYLDKTISKKDLSETILVSEFNPRKMKNSTELLKTIGIK